MVTPNLTGTSSPRIRSNTPMPKCRGFKMASLNITSLLKHIDELRGFLKHRHSIAINETRLNESISDQEVPVQGYDIITLVTGQQMASLVASYVFYIRSHIMKYSVRTDLDSQLLDNT